PSAGYIAQSPASLAPTASMPLPAPLFGPILWHGPRGSRSDKASVEVPAGRVPPIGRQYRSSACRFQHPSVRRRVQAGVPYRGYCGNGGSCKERVLPAAAGCGAADWAEYRSETREPECTDPGRTTQTLPLARTDQRTIAATVPRHHRWLHGAKLISNP